MSSEKKGGRGAIREARNIDCGRMRSLMKGRRDKGDRIVTHKRMYAPNGNRTK